MSTTTDTIACRWAGSDQPRMLVGRHDDECPGGDCRGCQRCTLDHCLSCGKEHSEHVCPGCLGDVRTDLAEIARLCDALPEEAEAKGVESEAFVLLGPVSDPEARGHAEASYKAGRLPEGWLETASHGKECPLLVNDACIGCGASDWHPLLVAGTWMEAYVEAFDHPEPGRITVSSALSYLSRNLDHIGTEDDIPFRDFARDLQRCRSHLERVLHDGEQIETGAPCMTCGKKLRRVYERDQLPWSHKDGSRPIAPEDGWACAKCRELRSEQDYRLNVRQVYIDEAEVLSLADLALRLDADLKELRRLCAPVRVSERGEIVELPPRLRPVGRLAGRKVYRVSDAKELLRSA